MPCHCLSKVTAPKLLQYISRWPMLQMLSFSAICLHPPRGVMSHPMASVKHSENGIFTQLRETRPQAHQAGPKTPCCTSFRVHAGCSSKPVHRSAPACTPSIGHRCTDTMLRTAVQGSPKWTNVHLCSSRWCFKDARRCPTQQVGAILHVTAIHIIR